MFNLEILDHLERVLKALHVPDSAEASQLLNDSIKLIRGPLVFQFILSYVTLCK